MLIVHHKSSTELLKEKDILQSESMIVGLLSSLLTAPSWCIIKLQC